MQCQLWRHSMGDPRVPDFEMLDEMAGEEGYTSNISDSTIDDLWHDTGGLPDFGFLTGDRWLVATREDRKNLNRYAATFFRKYYGIAAPIRFDEGAYRDSCRIRLSLMLLNPDGEDGAENDILARAETELPKTSGEPARITYILIKHQPEAWRLVDIEIDGESLASAYRERWVTLVREEGFDGLVRHLAGMLVDRGL